MRLRPCLLVLALLVAAPASAEFFRYVDDHGRVHFVASESQIPPRFRSSSGKAATRSFNEVDEAVAAERSRASRHRLRKLRSLNRSLDRQQRAAAARRTPAPPAARAPGPEPRKYKTNCNIRNANGRCGRTRSAAWDRWKREKDRYEASRSGDDD